LLRKEEAAESKAEPELAEPTELGGISGRALLFIEELEPLGALD